ncbi:SPOR domain-containing protein [Vibrio superstes]|uniref:Cell division protein DedD n=1 Tax=Vibrio superstes NBRC 103154 TaxID=1219062 RepID=A0A511QRN8_9VIBR|nr:SPOR domain-containing protein [Vibrio superstes]GEM80009.1 cell division protein DedD [Vibrio superstes NBRC 103154]
MASKFQSRLVGTIVLVAVGVIVLPDVLDGEKLHYKEEFVAIPIKPQLESEVESFEIQDPVEEEVSLPPEPVEEVIHESEKTQTAQVEKKVEPAPKPKAEPKPKLEVVEVKERKVEERNDYEDSAWIIQLVAVSSKENADGMVKDLRNRGFIASVRKAGNIYRVIVGPDVSRSKLESQLPELKKLTGEQGQIQTFKPLKP